jgi:hypothetical protein
MDQPVPDADTLPRADPGGEDAPQLETVYDYWEG